MPTYLLKETLAAALDYLQPKRATEALPGHSYDSVIYLMELGGKRVVFTGDLGFEGQDILNRCWGDVDKAAAVTEVVGTRVLEFRPDVVFTGHDAHRDGTAFIEKLVAHSREAIRKARSK